MTFSRREEPVPKRWPGQSWASEIYKRRKELWEEAELLRMMARFEPDPALRKLQEQLVKDLEKHIIIPPDEIGVKLEDLAR